MRRALAPTAAAIMLALVVGPAALAAPPAALTRAATRVTVDGATLTGEVNPRGLAATYHFEYGATPAYTASTPQGSAGAGRGRVRVTARVAGLPAGTRFHYRLVAQNADGPAQGADRTFATRPPRPSVSLNVRPISVLSGASVTFTGTVFGTSVASRSVQVSQNPFPFSAPFAKVASPVLTNAQGAFAVTVPSVPVTTRYRVRVGVPAPQVSQVVTVTVLARVGMRVTRTRVPRGGRVRFSGSVRPAEVNRPLAIQRRRNGRWVTVAGMVTRPRNPDVVVYGKAIRVRRAGLYRVFVGVGSGASAPNVGRAVRIRLAR